MACSLKNNFSVSWSNETILCSKPKGVLGFFPSIRSLKFAESKSRFMGTPISLSDQKDLYEWSVKAPNNFSVHAQTSIYVSQSMSWWEKSLKPNMIEIRSAQELVDSLLNAGDRLVIVDFYSPSCGGCKSLHPKICQLAESNPNAIFLNVNYDELKAMCDCLYIQVLPFFRFYRGPEGRVCSFSCTSATIKKFKDALAKFGTDRSVMGPAKGLDESEILRLASRGEISINFPLQSTKEERMEDLVLKGMDMSSTLNKTGKKMEFEEERKLLVA
ncbi:hypothetical protein F0562_024883 [Nyssa sinensis]|uniref:Thioredoxin domain-containing protein n=1 Tax=Nyssa sinensis TaxID=561372 RepID=A0A5J5BE23_9ASTE|nr:hypothetical protein F0562_024883 [Nyssa sinensis]